MEWSRKWERQESEVSHTPCATEAFPKLTWVRIGSFHHIHNDMLMTELVLFFSFFFVFFLQLMWLENFFSASFYIKTQKGCQYAPSHSLLYLLSVRLLPIPFFKICSYQGTSDFQTFTHPGVSSQSSTSLIQSQWMTHHLSFLFTFFTDFHNIILFLN